MSKRPDDLDLMRYVDGELSAEEREALVGELKAGTEAEAKVRSMVQVGDVVRTYSEIEADAAERKLELMWSKIETAVGVPAARKPAQPNAWARFGGWLERHRSNFFTSVVTAAAVAGLFLVFRPVQGSNKPDKPVAVKATADAGPAAQLAQSSRPVVERLEVDEGSATVFTIPADEDVTATTVIWVTQPGLGDPI